MKEQLFKVTITNDILGNSEDQMTYEKISNFNLVAKKLADDAIRHGGKHSCGMWSVEKVNK